LDPLVVGAVLAGMHSVHVEVSIEDWPVHEWYVRPIGESRWTELVAAAREHGAPFADPLRACAHAMIAAEDVLRAPRDVQLCHRDVFADNVLPTASGGICVIDWENSGPAEPAQELALALYDFAGRDAGRVTAMYRSYVQHGGPARLVDASDFTMVIASLHHITERHISRWLDPALQSARAHSAAGVFEFLAEPPTLDLVDSMLEAIRA
jgi:aminoglycoside phosphotransferase (APT) family kinase protein